MGLLSFWIIEKRRNCLVGFNKCASVWFEVEKSMSVLWVRKVVLNILFGSFNMHACHLINKKKIV